MTMATTPSLTMARPHTMVERAKHDGPVAPARAEATGRPAAMAIEDLRERAQEEFKRIWSQCTLMH